MTPGHHDVELLGLHGRGQQQIGEFRGVGDEMLTDDGEQVVTHQAAHGLLLRRAL